MSLSTGQDDLYEELNGLSYPPVDIITALQREHVTIDLSDRDKAEAGYVKLERIRCNIKINLSIRAFDSLLYFYSIDSYILNNIMLIVF